MRCSSGKKIRFFTAVNKPYLPYARALSRSLQENDGSVLRVYTVNCVADDLPDTRHVAHRMEDRLIGKYTYEQAYCMRMRAFLFPKVMNDFRGENVGDGFVFWIDADSIVRSSLDGLRKHVEDCDVTAKAKSDGCHASGVMGFDGNALPLATRYRDLVDEDEHWKSDQRGLDRLISEMPDTICFKPLPETFCDTMFSDDGVIWTSKIKCHNEPKWLKEYEHYLS
jgi:hypothetical protein